MANNDHAQDRYDPPGVGSDFEQQVYGDVVKGEVFRISPNNSAKKYRKIDETICHDIEELPEQEEKNVNQIELEL